MLRVKRAVRHWSFRPEELAPTGAETAASWQRMMERVKRPDSDTERRMAEVERELNRLRLDEPPNLRKAPRFGPPALAFPALNCQGRGPDL